LLENRDEPERVRASGLVAERLRSLTDPQRILDGYAELLDDGRRAAPGPAGRNRSRRPPLVTGIVPYFRASEHVEEAIGSLLAQTHRELEVLVVNDGSFEQDDEVLARLDDPRVEVVTTLNAGETSARNLGARLARGEYVAMLDSDNVLEPEFVARALAVFEREPELAYVSCWLRFIAPDGSPHADPAGYAPIGNSVVRDDTDNWDGDTLALLPRKVFTDLGYGFDPSAVIYSDWELYRRLREDGRFGTVIPERLAKYRVLPESLQRAHGLEMRRRGWDEARGRRILRRTRWTAEA
jgi:glycosyltransferase involved in cell wall biosynthesis